MKKCCIVFGLLFIIIATAVLTAEPVRPQANGEFLRMHVRAASDSHADQSVKYAVKDAVVAYLIPLAAECESKEQAMRTMKNALEEIESVASQTLAEHGFSYGARAYLRKEEFPTRVYENVTLEAGVYDALIVELGGGAGANWWCVIYPPLCFAGEAKGEGIRYRSRLWEIVQNFFAA